MKEGQWDPIVINPDSTKRTGIYDQKRRKEMVLGKENENSPKIKLHYTQIRHYIVPESFNYPRIDRPSLKGC